MANCNIARFKPLMILAEVSMTTACSSTKHSLYDMGLNNEYNKAGLSLKITDTDNKSIAFSESERNPSKPTIILIQGLTANKENWCGFRDI